MNIVQEFKLVVGHRRTEIAYTGGDAPRVSTLARSSNLLDSLGCLQCQSRATLKANVPKLSVLTFNEAEVGRSPSLALEVDIVGCPVLRHITRGDDSLLSSTGCGSRLKRHSHPMPVSRP